MSAQQVDRKINVLFDKYRDNFYAYTASQDIETIRKKAYYTGTAMTTFAFVANEFVRMSMRSRKYNQSMC